MQRSPRTIPTGVGKTHFCRCRNSISSDHPHGRGENSYRLSGKHLRRGPSPRAWGKRMKTPVAKREKRTIPTGVGKTWKYDPVEAIEADHPHGRGENLALRPRRLEACGPSPRAWGKRLLCRGVKMPKRTIPTGVGKTPNHRQNRRFFSDHPHGRGENPLCIQPKRHSCGPSPRAWGKLIKRNQCKRIFRTIPTGVGKTLLLTV